MQDPSTGLTGAMGFVVAPADGGYTVLAPSPCCRGFSGGGIFTGSGWGRAQEMSAGVLGVNAGGLRGSLHSWVSAEPGILFEA